MKRFFALFLTMAMVLSLAACGGKKESAEPAADKNESASTETTNSDWPKKTINIYMTHGAGGDTETIWAVSWPRLWRAFWASPWS